MAPIWLLLLLTPASCLLRTHEGRHRLSFLTWACVESPEGRLGLCEMTHGFRRARHPPAVGAGCRSGTLGPGARRRPDTGRVGVAPLCRRPSSSDCPRGSWGGRGGASLVRGALCPREPHVLPSQPPTRDRHSSGMQCAQAECG